MTANGKATLQTQIYLKDVFLLKYETRSEYRRTPKLKIHENTVQGIEHPAHGKENETWLGRVLLGQLKNGKNIVRASFD